VSSQIPEYHGHETPEQAALAGWAPVSHAFVVRSYVVADDEVHAIVDIIPSHPMDVAYVLHDDGLWYDHGDCGPSTRLASSCTTTEAPI